MRARALSRHGRGGAIVAVAGVHDRIPWPGFSHYSASKGRQRLFDAPIAKELAPHDIRVSAVAPGAIATPINEEMLEDPQVGAAVERGSPLRG